MYTMTPAQPQHRPAIDDMIGRRRAWLHDRDLVGSLPAPSDTTDFVGRLDITGRPLAWVGHDEDGILRGATTLLTGMPDDTWTEEERAEPTLLISGTWTDPDTRSDRLAHLITLWALDHTARLGKTSLRATTTCTRLAHHFCAQGWLLQRTVRAGRHERHLLSRRAQFAPPGLGHVIDTAPVSPAGFPTPRGSLAPPPAPHAPVPTRTQEF